MTMPDQPQRVQRDEAELSAQASVLLIGTHYVRNRKYLWE
jgi:hypothetical protein